LLLFLKKFITVNSLWAYEPCIKRIYMLCCEVLIELFNTTALL